MTRNIRWSVALATYNGQAYVAEQLASIARQTHLPAEVVVIDDFSRDATPDIARSWIALCDQDDIWENDKLELLTSAITSDPAASLVFTDASLIDQEAEVLPGSVWQTTRVDFDPRSNGYEPEDAFDFHLNHSVVMGATSAVPGWMREVALPFPDIVGPRPVPWKLHDGWLALVAATRGHVIALPEKTIRYRVHPHQEVGVGDTGRDQHSLSQRDILHRRYQQSAALWTAAGRSAGPPVSTQRRQLLREETLHLEKRLSLPGGVLRRVPIVSVELATGRYSRWSGGWRSAARDAVDPPVRMSQ